MASMVRIWYDQEGDFLEITFREAKGYLREIAEDIYERVDEAGNLLGYTLFNVTCRRVDFSWLASAQKYVKLYRRAIKVHGT